MCDVDNILSVQNIISRETRLHKSRSSRSELEFDLSNFVYRVNNVVLG